MLQHSACVRQMGNVRASSCLIMPSTAQRGEVMETQRHQKRVCYDCSEAVGTCTGQTMALPEPSAHLLEPLRPPAHHLLEAESVLAALGS